MKCSKYWPEGLQEKIEYVERNIQSGQIRKVGDVTEIVLIVETPRHFKVANHFVFDGQILRSVTAVSYDWAFPKADDIANPPKQKEFILKNWTVWTREK